uniref:28S ribosomal protein S22, mitochondrial-like n=1 Tax=Crassostrea virginica TaxID=6565 RepID=A0A8B8ETM0_CRAVI|nr:28S ribosomal protein S22, mitochondrial-like [Crassostrea virginica]
MTANLTSLKFLRTFRKLSCFHSQLLLLRGSSAFRTPQMPEDIDPFPLFMKDEVQKIMNDITGVDLNRSAEMKWSKSPSKSTIKVVPDDELQKLQAHAVKKERSKIEQRPPFMKPREEINQELSRDPEIAPVMTQNLLFIDISSYTRPETANKEKVVVMRDTEGTLRMATQEERDRAIQIAFPARDRRVVKSTFFKPESIQNALQNCRYSYILDKVCVQYDPDHPEFSRISKQIFDHILERGEFDALRGTRHFGSLAFYLALCRQETPLVLDMLKRKLVLDACDYVRLNQVVHPKKLVPISPPKQIDENFVKKLMTSYLKQRQSRELKLVWNSLCEEGLSEIIQENMTQRKLIIAYLEM